MGKLFRIKELATATLLLLAVQCGAAEPLAIAGVQCQTPPPLHCPDENCPADIVTDPGPVLEPESERRYFLDFSCDLKKSEPVNLILSLHGGGSYGNWQRHYFPLLNYLDEYNLVVATPNTRAWSPEDDPYLENILTGIIEDVGAENIRSFWLVGHSMGSFNSRRLVCSDFYRDKVDGYLSLSGGRIGAPPATPGSFNIPRQNDDIARAAPPPERGDGPPGGGLFAAAASISLDCEFSHIFAAGEHEPSAQNLPEDSPRAERYACDARELTGTVEDTQPGYVFDSTRQQYGTNAWGREPRPGNAQVMQYPNCEGGRVVADVIRLDKGHTEGLEPNITQTLIELMLSASGGKISGNY